MTLAADAATRVEGLRLWQDADRTRLVFDLSAQARHRVSIVENPTRLIIDLDDSRLHGSLQGVTLQGTPIRRIRSGMFTTADLRIVLDLHTGVAPQSFLLPPSDGFGNRLVVDVIAKGSFPAAMPDVPDRTAPAPARTPESAPVVDSAGPGADQLASTLPLPLPTAPAATPEPPARIVVPSKPARAILIAIDAGHGGDDPGALGPRRAREKDVVLAIARELERRVNQQPGYRAMMVRKGDYFIPLKKRRDIARAAGADLFVSIHADAFTHSRARGGSVYALSPRGATSTSAAFLAQRENGADLIGGIGLGAKDEVLAEVLTDLSMTATMESSLTVGNRVLGSMGRVAHLHARRVEQAGFVVLKSPDMPSILVETGFISNPADAERLATRAYQRQLAKAIFEGLGDYFLSTPPPGTHVALAVAAGAHPAEYVIARGDTLSGIAERYRVSVADIVRTNRLGDSGGIQAGQRILIPKS